MHVWLLWNKKKYKKIIKKMEKDRKLESLA